MWARTGIVIGRHHGTPMGVELALKSKARENGRQVAALFSSKHAVSKAQQRRDRTKATLGVRQAEAWQQEARVRCIGGIQSGAKRCGGGR